MKTTHRFSALLKFITVSKLLLLLSLLSITACAILPGANTQNSEPTNSTQVVYEYLTAKLQGRLVMDNRCLRVINDYDERSSLLVWPSDFAVTLEGDTVHITQGVVTGNPINYDLHIGDDIAIGGGTSDVGDKSSFRISPASCPGPYWAFYGLAKK